MTSGVINFVIITFDMFIITLEYFLLSIWKEWKFIIVLSGIDINTSHVCLLHGSSETIDHVMSSWISTCDILVAVDVYLYRILCEHILVKMLLHVIIHVIVINKHSLKVS